MKADLAELLRGTTLRSQIYKTISGTKMASFAHLLRNAKKVKYLDSASEGPEPPLAPQHHRSLKKLSASSQDHSLSQHKPSNQTSREKPKAQRSQRRPKAASTAQDSQQRSEYLLNNSQKPRDKQKQHKQPAGLSPSSSKQSGSSNREKSTLSKSKSKLSCRMNLESIIQQSSSEELVTPHARKRAQLPDSAEKTAKKERKELIPEQLRRKMSRSFTEPQKFIRLLRNEAVSVSYRVLKRRLIEIEVFVHRNIDELTVRLERGNLECQGIQETYHHLPANTLLPLFSSVRDLNLLEPYRFPQLSIELRPQHQQQTVQTCLPLPYSFLNFAEEREGGRRSRIKTKLCLEKLPIHPKRLRILSQAFKVWGKRHFKGQAEFETSFSVGEHDFTLRLIEERDTFALELEGRGEERMSRLIDFLSRLIC